MIYSECKPSAGLHSVGLRLALVLACLSASLGCNSFGNGKLVKQLQLENERLLGEFRAERQRREESERLNSTLEARLSESEKLLARQTQGTIPNRLSSLPSNSGQRTRPMASSEPNSGSDNPGQGSDNQGNPDYQWQRRVN